MVCVVVLTRVEEEAARVMEEEAARAVIRMPGGTPVCVRVCVCSPRRMLRKEEAEGVEDAFIVACLRHSTATADDWHASGSGELNLYNLAHNDTSV